MWCCYWHLMIQLTYTGISRRVHCAVSDRFAHSAGISRHEILHVTHLTCLFGDVRAGLPRNLGFILICGKIFLCSYIGSGAQVAYSAGAGRYFLGDKAAGAWSWHPHLVPMLRMLVSVAPLLCKLHSSASNESTVTTIPYTRAGLLAASFNNTV